jgi:hypothetical protein
MAGERLLAAVAFDEAVRPCAAYSAQEAIRAGFWCNCTSQAKASKVQCVATEYALSWWMAYRVATQA